MPLRHRALLPAILVASLALGGAACSDEKLTPEEARTQRVEERLKLSFSDEQVACMLDEFDESIMIALDGEGNLPQGADLDVFSAAAQQCVLENGGTVPGGSGSAPTTDASTTTSEADDTAPDTEPPATEPAPPTQPDADAGTPPGAGDTRPETGNADNGDAG